MSNKLPPPLSGDSSAADGRAASQPSVHESILLSFSNGRTGHNVVLVHRYFCVSHTKPRAITRCHFATSSLWSGVPVFIKRSLLKILTSSTKSLSSSAVVVLHEGTRLSSAVAIRSYYYSTTHDCPLVISGRLNYYLYITTLSPIISFSVIIIYFFL